MLNKVEHRNILKIYLFTFLGNNYFERGIFILYLLSKGLSLLEIGVFQALINTFMFISEIPTGIIADKYGKKRSLIIGRGLMILYLVIMLISNSTIEFYIAAILMGIAFTFLSGAEEALLYDTLKSHNLENKATKYIGLYGGITTVALAIAMGVGGYVQKFQWEFVFVLSIIFQSFSFLIGLTLKEPVMTDSEVSEERISYKSIISSCFKFLKENKITRNFIIITALNVGVVSSLYIFAQEILSKNGLSVNIISYFFSVESIISAIVFTFVYKIVNKFGNDKTIYVTSIINILAFLSLITFKIQLAIPILLISIMNNICTTISFVIINEELESKERATMLSIYSFLSSLVMSIIAISIGGIAKIIDMRIVFGAIGSVITILYIFIYIKYQRENNLKCELKGVNTENVESCG